MRQALEYWPGHFYLVISTGVSVACLVRTTERDAVTLNFLEQCLIF